MTHKIIEVDRELITAITTPFSPKYELTPLRILRMISYAKGETAEKLVRNNLLLKRGFHFLLKNIMPKHYPVPGRITQLLRGGSATHFYGFIRIHNGHFYPLTGDERRKGPYHAVTLQKEAREICEALRSEVDYIILLPKARSSDSEFLVIPRKEQEAIEYNDFLSRTVPPNFWEQEAISPPLVYPNHRNGRDVVTHSIIKHSIKVSLSTRRVPRTHIPVSYSSDVFQIRQLQRFPKIRGGFGLNYEILVDGERIEDTHKCKIRHDEYEYEQLEVNDMEIGRPHKYRINFVGKYPVIQKRDSSTYFMCTEHFLGKCGTTIEVESDSSFIIESLDMVVANFDGYARTVDSFLTAEKYPPIVPLFSFKRGVIKCHSQYLDVVKIGSRQGKKLTFALTPRIHGTFNTRSGASQLSLNSRIFHEFVFIRYAIDRPLSTVERFDGERCCRLSGLSCKDCMKSVGLWI